MEVREETVEQISRELHDNVGHGLILAKLQIKAVANQVGGDAAVQLSKVLDLLTDTLDTIRDISKSLNSDIIRQAGLNVAIEEQLERLKTGLEIHFHVYGTYHYMDDNTEMVLFRIFQEAISNVVSHAQAKNVSVILECNDRSLVLIISDDGVGFQMGGQDGHPVEKKHIGGLKTMRTRAGLIKADFQIESQPGVGTKIRVAVPYTSKTATNE